MSSRRTLLSAGAALATLPWWQAAAARDAPPPRPRMGINLGGLNYWNTELPFVDLMRMAGPWSLWRADGGARVESATPNVDARGWLRELPAGLVAMTPLAAQSHLPRGRWVVLYDGRGEIDLQGALRVVQRAPGRLECDSVTLSPLPDPSVWLRILATDPADPLRRIRVFKPGTEQQAESDPWDAGFVARWRGWAALRAMDILATNNSTLTQWNDRPHPDDRTFAPRGLAIEWLIDLANRCASAPWLCLPHAADDDFLRSCAALVRERLDASLPVWIEHSNEVWNPDFKQADYASQQGMAAGLAADANTARWRWHARRSRDIFRFWGEAFGGTQRLVRVLATQTGNTWGTRQLLRDGTAQEVDALGVGAYLPLTPGVAGPLSAAEVARWPLDRVFEHLNRELKLLRDLQREQRAWGREHGLRLAAYEGGQHAVGIGEATSDAALQRLFTAANRDERMGTLYRALFDQWQQMGGDLFCHFSSVSPPNPWGNWGLLEHHDDKPAERPKYRETLARMQRWKQG